MNPGRKVSSVAPEVEMMRHCDDSADPKQMMEWSPHQTMQDADRKVSESSLT